jgi:transketolase N-terminal domain/subunit
MTTAEGSGHSTSAASLAHIVTVVLYHHMRYDPADPNHPAADHLVLSEGHACPIIYAAAADLGMAIGREREFWRPMTRENVLGLRDIDSELDGHPNSAEGFPFFAAASAAFLLFGLALIYAALGTMEFERMAMLLATADNTRSVFVLTGLAMTITGIGFKLAVVPFHM